MPSRRQFVFAALGAAATIASNASANAPDSGFVQARGKDLIDPAGKKLFLRGINLGNWFEPEGYMFLFEGGPQ
ncbi:MAG: glycoside hydrolase family 5 protein, partial [Acidobacteriota bacterium]|nr:glycoside hydrolase family 5 protein [Acidobacteriota bacterium]